MSNDKKLIHTKGPDYRIHNADGCIGTQVANGQVQLIFYKEANNIQYEQLIPVGANANEFSTAISDEAVTQYREDETSVIMTVATVQALVELLSKSLDNWNKHPASNGKSNG